MATTKMVIEIRVAWWFMWIYLAGVNALIRLGMALGVALEPNPEHFDRVLQRAVTYHFRRRRDGE